VHRQVFRLVDRADRERQVMSGLVPGIMPVKLGAVTPTIGTARPSMMSSDRERRSASESPRPERVADHGGRIRGGLIRFAAESAAERHPDAEHAVERTVDPEAGRVFEAGVRRHLERRR
jgi:hypothetical protein